MRVCFFVANLGDGGAQRQCVALLNLLQHQPDMDVHLILLGAGEYERDLDTSDLGTAATIVEQAISQVATLRGKLGAIQKNAVESNIRSLQTSLEQVTAAQSTIRDADFAIETAQLTRSQILVQAGTNVLALANQAPQNVLSLLRG